MILATLLKESRLLGTRTAYSAQHEPREYCVQYRETDATVFHRLATEEGNVRIEKTATDRKAETGGNYTHKVQGRIDIEASEAIRQLTQLVEHNASERLIIRGPGGTITIDDNGIRIEAIEIRIKGPLRVEGGGVANALSMFGNPAEGDAPEFP